MEISSTSAGRGWLAVLAITAVISHTPGPAHAGPLTPPPGAPAPTMKTLDQVEPRTPLSTLAAGPNHKYVIDRPGSYYLTGDVVADPGKHAISLASDHITLDLNGFAIIGRPQDFTDAFNTVAAPKNTVIRNGTIRGWGGYAMIGSVQDSVIENLRVMDCVAGGIELGGVRNTIVRGVSVARVAEVAIRVDGNSIITECVVDGGFTGITAENGCSIRNCVVRNSAEVGIDSSQGVVEACAAVLCGSGGGHAGIGINVSFGGIVKNCSASQNTGPGIRAEISCSVVENTCAGNAVGIQVRNQFVPTFKSKCRIEGNHVTGNTVGIQSPQPGNFIVRNTAVDNTVEYDLVAGNSVGTIQTTPVGAGAWDNFDF